MRLLLFLSLFLPMLVFGQIRPVDGTGGTGSGGSSGTATNLGAGATGDSTNSSGTVAFTNALISQYRYVDSVYGNNATARANDLLKPWLSPHNAVTSAPPGTLIFLREGDHDIGLTNINLPAGVHLWGESPATTLRSTVGLFTNGCVIGLGSTSTVGNLRGVLTKRASYYQAFIGACEVAGQAAFTNARVFNVSGEGGTDFFFVNKTAPCSGSIYSLNVTSKWDAFVAIDAAHQFDLWNSQITCDLKGVTLTDAISAGIARPILLGSSSAIRIFDCVLVATNANNAYGIHLPGGDTAVIHGGSIMAAGTNAAWHIYGDEECVIKYWGNQTTLTNVSGPSGVPVGIEWGGSSPYLVRGFYPVASGMVLQPDSLTAGKEIRIIDGRLDVPTLSWFTNAWAVPNHGAGTDVVWGGTNANGKGRWKALIGTNGMVVHHPSAGNVIVVSNTVLQLADTLLTVGNETDVASIILATTGENLSFSADGISPASGGSTMGLGSQAAQFSNMWTRAVNVSAKVTYADLVIAGAGNGNTNYTLLAGRTMYMGSSNVNILAVMDYAATGTEFASASITNLSANTWGISFSSVTNRLFFAGIYGTNAPTVLTNDTRLELSIKSQGTNTWIGYTYFKPAR